MKKAILASAFLLAFTMTAAGQTKKATKRATRTPQPMGWKVNGKPCWNLEDAWNVGLKGGPICAVMPANSLRFGGAAGNLKFLISIALTSDSETVRRNGSTVTYRDILIDGRPAQVRYGEAYFWRYILRSLTVPASLDVGFERLDSAESADDFIVFGEGTITETGWNDDGPGQSGNRITNYWRNETHFVIDHVYVFKKEPEVPVYHFVYAQMIKWEREAPTTAKADKP